MKRSSDGIQASSICRHDVGRQAPMNGATAYDGRHHMFAAGLDDECHLFSLKYRVISPMKSGNYFWTQMCSREYMYVLARQDF